MKIYTITDKDVDRLVAYLDRNPTHGRSGGSSQPLSAEERRVYDDAHGFFNYQIRKWLDEVRQ